MAYIMKNKTLNIINIAMIVTFIILIIINALYIHNSTATIVFIIFTLINVITLSYRNNKN